MTRKICIRLIGTLTCIAMVAAGWDAEAGWRRHHRHASNCCEPVCDPCCAPAWVPVCETACNPCCEPVCVTRYVEPATCCRSGWVSTVIEETVIVPSRSCCDGRVVATEGTPAVTRSALIEASRPTPAEQPADAATKTASVLSSSRLTRPTTAR